MTRQHRPFAATGLAVAALALAACGGSGPASTNASSQSGKDGPGAAFQFAACMRAHGLPNFPDPVVHSSAGQTSVAIRVTPALVGSPAFKSAQHACGNILPPPGSKQNEGETPAQQHAREQDILAFGRCLRSHGITNFPDPNPQGQLPLSQVTAAGVDIHSPGFETAALTCLPATNGLLTRAQVLQAVNGSQ